MTRSRMGTTQKKTAGAHRTTREADGEINNIQKLVHLLQVNQIELEHQNNELRTTEEELEKSIRKYVNLFDFSPIPYFVLDQNGVVKEVNLNGGKMFGVDRSRMIGKLFILHLATEQKGIFTAFMREVLRSAEKQSCKISVTNKQKRLYHVLLEGIRLDDASDPEQRCHIALIDLTEQKNLEESYKELSEELTALKRGQK